MHARPDSPSQATSFTGRKHELEGAATLLEAAEILRSVINIKLLPNERVEYDRELGALRREMNEQMFDFAWSNGQAMTMVQSIECAFANSE